MEQQPYSVTQASKRLGLSVRTIRRYIHLGRFKHLIVIKYPVRDYHYLTENSIKTFLSEYERPASGGHYKRRRKGKKHVGNSQ